jgi:alkylated DNA nucleotide flippase Atl1
MRKSWLEKMEDKPGLPKTLKFDPKFPCGKALEKMGAEKGDSVIITQAGDVIEVMKKVPNGKLITLREICMELAKKHKVKYCCTLVAGIHVMTAANAAEENKGKQKLPYWRTLKNTGQLNPKYPGGEVRQKKLLEAEGHKVIKKAGGLFVSDYEKKIFVFVKT